MVENDAPTTAPIKTQRAVGENATAADIALRHPTARPESAELARRKTMHVRRLRAE
jgi:hypothetical protein